MKMYTNYSSFAFISNHDLELFSRYIYKDEYRKTEKKNRDVFIHSFIIKSILTLRIELT
jgi:hypothetical protein